MKPELGLHVVPIKLFVLNKPKLNIAAITIAMISIAHPYVIRYSIADWDFIVGLFL